MASRTVPLAPAVWLLCPESLQVFVTHSDLMFISITVTGVSITLHCRVTRVTRLTTMSMF